MKKHTRKMLKDSRGSVLPLVGLILGAVVVATGIAVDYGRAQMVQSKLHAALDAAGLAAGATAKSRDVTAEVLKYVEANFPQGYMETTYQVDTPVDVQTVVDPETTEESIIINVHATGEMQTSFMDMFAIPIIDVEATNQVIQARGRGLEMVMVLDNSGSMSEVQGGISRRNAMVNAAKTMINELYGPGEFYPNLFVGLVNFTARINVGSAKAAASNWLRADAADIPISGSIDGCMDDRTIYRSSATYSATDDPPVIGRAPSALFRSAQMMTGCSESPFSAMQNTKSDILAALDTVQAEGATRVDLGAVWGWRMISPRWRGFWAHEGPALPLNYNTEDMDKVIILLTDGANNPTVSQINDGSNLAQTNARLTQVCSSMKAQGIIVYSIIFHLNNPDTQALMRGCATSDDHYFFAAGNDSIDQVFKEITDSLMSLRLSR